MAPDRAPAEPWLRAGEDLSGLVEVRLSALARSGRAGRACGSRTARPWP
ncbi:hypothetical protein ABTX81_31000 [Kitasatospora sp. NPDC097605]